jgi:hypothetical protein
VKLAMAIAELRRSETKLAHHLRGIAARHHSDSDVSHLASDLADWSDDHVQALKEHGRRYHVSPIVSPWHIAATAPLQRRVSEMLRRRPEPALLLLADLRWIHRMAAGVSLDWELLAQGAQAVKDDELLALTSRCHPETLRQMRWANAMLKELAPQALTA